MSEREELKPCPFCGGKAERVDIDEGENAGGSCICCTVCQASSNVEFEFRENFVSNWNRRATRPPSDAGAEPVAEVERDRKWFNAGWEKARELGADPTHPALIAAKRAERERCARVAEEFQHDNPWPTRQAAIAAAIRALDPTENDDGAGQ